MGGEGDGGGGTKWQGVVKPEPRALPLVRASHSATILFPFQIPIPVRMCYSLHPPINYIWFKTKPMVVDGMYGQWIVIYCPITDVKCTQDVSLSSMYLDFHCVRTNGISFHFRHLYCSQDVWPAGLKSYRVILPQCQVRLAMIIEFGLTSEPLVRFFKFKRL